MTGNNVPWVPPGQRRRDTSRTDAIRRNGLQGLREIEQARQGAGDPTMRRQYLEAGGVPLSGAGNPMYDRLSSRVQPPTQYDIMYGRTLEGDYSGFKNASDLKAAVQGRGETLRQEERDRALAMQQLAEQYLEQMATDYDKSYKYDAPTNDEIARTQHMPSPGSPSEMAAIMGTPSAPSDAELRARGGHMPSPGSPSEIAAVMSAGQPSGEWQKIPVAVDTGWQDILNATEPSDLYWQMAAANDYAAEQTSKNAKSDAERRAADQGNQALADQMAAVNTKAAKWSAETAPDREYNDALNAWLADNAGQYLDAQDAADLMMTRPGRDYWLTAAADYGVDPNIARGWYDEASQIKDFTEQRDLAALDQYGMPYSEFQGLVNDQQTAEEQAAEDAATGDEQAMNQYVQDVTGYDPQQLATAADVNVPMLYDMVNTAEFQQATADIINSATSPEAVQGILDQWMVDDPAMYRVLDSMFGDYGVE